MTKRARFSGQYETQVAVDTGNVFTKFVTVKPGGLLPTETDDGDPVPASVRDDLIKNHPDFSEVTPSDTPPKAADKKEGGN